MKRYRTSRSAAAFTLMELAVIVFIITLLIGIVVPSITRARTLIRRTQAQATVNLLAGACELYKNDSNEYPDSTPTPAWGGMNGRQRLVQCLTGYRNDDGQAGGGWRPSNRATVRGPYNGAETIPTTVGKVFKDTFQNEIFYYRFDAAANGYHAADNDDAPAGLTLQAAPGPTDYLTPPGSTKYYTQTFAIMTAGPDKKFESKAANQNTDDVTSFRD